MCALLCPQNDQKMGFFTIVKSYCNPDVNLNPNIVEREDADQAFKNGHHLTKLLYNKFTKSLQDSIKKISFFY